jgi:site-specific recombinase XerD
MLPSVKIVLYTSKTLKNGEHPIMLRVIQDRKPKYISFGLSCNPKLWDKDNELPKKKHPFYKELALIIPKKKEDILKVIRTLEQDDEEYTSEEIINRFVGNRKGKRTSIIRYFEEVIERLEKSGRIGYADIFKSTKKSIINFHGEGDLTFGGINHSFLLSYEESLNSSGISLNAAFVYLRTLKTLINYAKNDKILNKEYNPFEKINFKKYRRIKTKKRALSKSDIYKIINCKLEPGSRLFRSQQIFTFSFFCRGINFIDIAHLTYNNIIDGRLIYVRKKNNKTFNIKLEKPAKKIIDYYKLNNDNNIYIFPILNELHKTPISIDNRLHKVLHQTNKDLREIADIAGVDAHLTTYVARHSYATILKNEGAAIAQISELMGHETEETTQTYLEEFGNTSLDEISKLILNHK